MKAQSKKEGDSPAFAVNKTVEETFHNGALTYLENCMNEKTTAKEGASKDTPDKKSLAESTGKKRLHREINAILKSELN